MFTGLITDKGSLVAREQQGSDYRLQLRTQLPVAEMALGESLAVNGVCLTVTALDAPLVKADVSPETLRSSTLGQLPLGSAVNLERALRVGDRLGGHWVTGHVDACSVLKRRYTEGNSERFWFQLPETIAPYVAAKGSIAVDGVSLTVNEVAATAFSVAVIPHSLQQTTLQHLQPGGQVNLESDILARYVAQLLPAAADNSRAKAAIDRNFLAEKGFLT